MDIHALAWAANVLFNLMTDEEKQVMDRAQKISFVYGNVKLSNPDITREMVEEVVDEKGAKK